MIAKIFVGPDIDGIALGFSGTTGVIEAWIGRSYMLLGFSEVML